MKDWWSDLSRNRKIALALIAVFVLGAIDAGVALNVVSQRLDHSSIRVTADVYTHVVDAVDREAAKALGFYVVARPRFLAGGSGDHGI